MGILAFWDTSLIFGGDYPILGPFGNYRWAMVVVRTFMMGINIQMFRIIVGSFYHGHWTDIGMDRVGMM